MSEPLANLSAGYLWLIGAIAVCGLCDAIWILRALRKNLTTFFKRTAFSILPFAAIYDLLNSYGWPLDLKLIGGFSAACLASMLTMRLAK